MDLANIREFIFVHAEIVLVVGRRSVNLTNRLYVGEKKLFE